MREVVDAWLVRLMDALPIERSKKTGTHRYYVLRGERASLFVHRIVESDKPGVYHTHPWEGLSFHIRPYIEETAGGRHRRRFLHRIHGQIPHRVEVDRPVWTLFLHGRRRYTWGYFDSSGNPLTQTDPWRGPDSR